MTISSTTNKTVLAGNGSTLAFAYTWYIAASNWNKVYKQNQTTGALTLQTETTHYTVTGVGSSGGGLVSFASASVPSSTQNVVIVRDPPLTQATDYVSNDAFPASSHEDALDKLTAIAQKLDEAIDRAFGVGVGITDMTSVVIDDLASARANALIGFNSAGTSVTLQSSSTAAVSAASSSATAASGSAATASGSAATASGSAASASGSAATASGSAASASGSAANASGSAASILSFTTIAASGQSSAVADATNDTLTLVAGSNMSLSIDPANDTITFAASGASAQAFTITSYDTAANVTGDGTQYTVLWPETTDADGIYNPATGIWTLATAGRYFWSGCIGVEGLVAGHTNWRVRIVHNATTYLYGILNPIALADSGYLSLPIAFGLNVAASDTVKVTVEVAGGAKVVDMIVLTTMVPLLCKKSI
jgi:hypothetical protein